MSDQPPPSVARRLILLGCTGSIGTNVVEVVEHLHRVSHFRFDVVGLAAGRNAAAMRRQAEQLGVEHVAIADERCAGELAGIGNVHAGDGAALEMLESIARPGDLVVGAMVGSAGVPVTLAALQRGCDVALANKETLVAAGALVMPLARRGDVRLLPIDSEHSAIFQCLLAGRSVDEVKRLIITASGGPFRTWPRERLEQATVEEALNHPTWEMGRKITIDSATMMNKALEIIEAHWLFGLPADKIAAIVHPGSVVHSFVEFVDGSTLAQLGPPDMRTPIQYALTWPHRAPGCSRTMDWDELRTLRFEPVDHERFPAVRLADRVIRDGGTAGAVFNAANEVAVDAFLEGRIGFGRILELVGAALDEIRPTPVSRLEDVTAADALAREHVRAAAGRGSGKMSSPESRRAIGPKGHGAEPASRSAASREA
jgi:1-deoxy-D-xylulose-5-phosphate reductoisomerase